ncbi:hypothetical protein [Enterococcus sp. AZ007]|uniref:hypothetical protein n=1 Tax=Enterococcus sp. AZ007 TaxID=2774839 RepID=UPI003F2943FB
MVVDITKLGTLLTKADANERLVYYTQQEWQQIVDHYSKKEADEEMKEKNQIELTVDWLNSSIQKLERFKTQVKQGQLIMTDGYMDDNYPVPQLDEQVENNISLSINFIEKK